MDHIALRPEWVEQYRAGTQNSTPSDLLAAALCADFHTIAAPSLPNDIASWPSGTLEGCLVLQVDEIVTFSAPARERYPPCAAGLLTAEPHRYPASHARDPTRTLKLLLTDGACSAVLQYTKRSPGHQQVPALELQHCPQLHADMHAGCKVGTTSVCDDTYDGLPRRSQSKTWPCTGACCCSPLRALRCWVARYAAAAWCMLSHRCTQVAALEAARQRMRAHWQQPIRMLYNTCFKTTQPLSQTSVMGTPNATSMRLQHGQHGRRRHRQCLHQCGQCMPNHRVHHRQRMRHACRCSPRTQPSNRACRSCSLEPSTMPLEQPKTPTPRAPANRRGPTRPCAYTAATMAWFCRIHQG